MVLGEKCGAVVTCGASGREKKNEIIKRYYGCNLFGEQFDGQESLVCCSPWGPKELDTTEQLN